MENPTRNVHLVHPPKHRHLRVSPPEGKAAGVAAVKESLRHLRREVGFFPGMRAIGQMTLNYSRPNLAWSMPQAMR